MSAKHNVVVVDDEPLMGELYERLFSSPYRCTIHQASTNEEAYIQILRLRPSLIITDMRRPGGLGEDFVEAVRTNPEFGEPAIIIVSGWLFARGAIDPRVFQFRIDGAFPKPFPQAALARAVARALRVETSSDVALIRSGIESATLDYKESVDLRQRSQRAALAKDILAFSNGWGGSIVIGMRDDVGRFTPVGVPEDTIPTFEVTRFNNALRVFVGQSLSVTCRVVSDGGLAFIVIDVPRSDSELRLAHAEDAAAGLFRGRIYVRTDSAQSCEAHDPVIVGQLIDRLARAHARRRS